MYGSRGGEERRRGFMSWAQPFPSDTRMLDGPGYENHEPSVSGAAEMVSTRPQSNNIVKDPIKSFNIRTTMSLS